MIDEINKKEFIEMVKASKGLAGADLSSGEDLSVAVMNLISIEEHLYFTGVKTDNKKYFGLLEQVRSTRVKLLKELINQPEGEVWCISKHLLAASMRLIEVGTKYASSGKEEEAEEKYGQAFDLYSLFWGINLDQSTKPAAILQTVQASNAGGGQSSGGFSRIRELVKRIVDCCREL